MNNFKQQKTHSCHFVLDVITNKELSNICGPLESNLTQIEQALGVTIHRHGNIFKINGKNSNQAQYILSSLSHKHTAHISTKDMQLAIIECLNKNKSQNSYKAHNNSMLEKNKNYDTRLYIKNFDVRARTKTQHEYLYNIQHHDITFGIGPAGTGKTFLAVACAIDALNQEKIKKIILTRPAVEAGERLGFLPGDLTQKVDPYLRPLYDALYDFVGFEQTNKLFERQRIEIAPLAYMRGRTLNEAFIILDEAQNTTHEQVKMFLTRIGFGSKAVITGDLTQIDLPNPQKSGLRPALTLLNKIPGIITTYFSSQDVVRHPLVAKIIEAYNQLQPSNT